MTAALDGRIGDVVETKLLTITIANGYQTTVVSVDRPPVAPEDKAPSELPAISVREGAKQSRTHLRDAEEMRIPFDLILTVEVEDGDDDGAVARHVLKTLFADVKKLIYANLRWNDGAENLAVRTWIESDTIHELEVVRDRMTARVTMIVLARASTSDPTAVKAV